MIHCLYLYCNKDKVIIPAYLNHIEDCFESIKVVQVDLGYVLREEKPELVAKHLNDFLLPFDPAACGRIEHQVVFLTHILRKSRSA